MAKNTLRGLFTQGRVEQLSSRIDLIERILESIVEGKYNPQPAPWEEERSYGVAHRPGGGPGPITDPGPSDEARLRATVHRPFADPAVSDETRIHATVRKSGPPYVDPVAPDLRRLQALAEDPEIGSLTLREYFLRRPGWVDPAVSDRTRLTAADLQDELHQISAERIRLDAREREVQQRLAEMKAVDAPKEG